ncbi:MAG: 4-hydroxyacetophenone monooxygenase, partial [Alphaproteobacteria bacterium]|nr:4-hydroxyacetophenone monooxygenase [Alphaproteobacteria bacterium]
MPNRIKPIADSDEAIARALEDAHLPSLMAAMVHVTGEASPLRGDIKPVYDFFGDGQGGLTGEQRARAKAQILAGLKTYRDRGCTLPPAPDEATLKEMMGFVAGAEIPDRYVPFLKEEMEFTGRDERAPEWGAKVPEAAKQNFRVLII